MRRLLHRLLIIGQYFDVVDGTTDPSAEYFFFFGRLADFFDEFLASELFLGFARRSLVICTQMILTLALFCSAENLNVFNSLVACLHYVKHSRGEGLVKAVWVSTGKAIRLQRVLSVGELIVLCWRQKVTHCCTLYHSQSNATIRSHCVSSLVSGAMTFSLTGTAIAAIIFGQSRNFDARRISV